MKKIIALALALIMALSMASVALAVAPGEDITVTSWADQAENFIKKNFKIKDIEWTKGGALVDEVKITKENELVVVLKENYTITDAKDLKGTITLMDKVNKTEYEYAVDTTVANAVVTVFGEEDADDCIAITAADNTLYVCDEDAPGYVKFNTNALLGATLNMAAKEKAFMYNDEAAIEALTEKFPEAEIECYNFGGQPTFKNAAKFTLQADYADQYYIYSYANGKLEAQDAEWDSIEGVYTWETKTPSSYVISDVELVAAADDATTNPDTGANDVVGVAAALAVVSLVAAGAVSLKK